MRIELPVAAVACSERRTSQHGQHDERAENG
jgi:hypothetical protein